MTSYLADVLGLFDSIIHALLGVPIFALFLGGFVAFAIFGLFLLLRDAASGKRNRR